MIGNFKEKLLNSSGSYNFYKQEYAKLVNQLNQSKQELKNKNIDLNNINRKLSLKDKELDKIRVKNQQLRLRNAELKSRQEEFKSSIEKIDLLEKEKQELLDRLSVLQNTDASLKIDEFDKSIKENNKKQEDISNKLNKFESHSEKIFDSYHGNFTTLFLDYDLKPKGALKDTHVLCQQLLDFVVNVCKKHDISYWLDYGNLLGAVRHGGFIPWDDDMDLGMIRKDYNLFLQVIEEEIKLAGLSGVLHVELNQVNHEGHVLAFTQLLYTPKKDELYGGLDVFPYDYISNYDDNTKRIHSKLQDEYRTRVKDGEDKDKIMDECYEKLNLSLDKQSDIISGVDSVRGLKRLYKFKILETDKIFPLGKVNFNGKMYSAPQDVDYYLKSIYGNYFKIPKIVRRHQRLNKLRETPNIDELYEKEINRLSKANKTFE